MEVLMQGCNCTQLRGMSFECACHTMYPSGGCIGATAIAELMGEALPVVAAPRPSWYAQQVAWKFQSIADDVEAEVEPHWIASPH